MPETQWEEKKKKEKSEKKQGEKQLIAGDKKKIAIINRLQNSLPPYSQLEGE